MIGVRVRQQNTGYGRLRYSRLADVGEEAVDVASRAGVYQGALPAAVNQVDVAVEHVRDPYPLLPAGHDVQVVGQQHGTLRRPNLRHLYGSW